MTNETQQDEQSDERDETREAGDGERGVLTEEKPAGGLPQSEFDGDAARNPDTSGADGDESEDSDEE